jgi:CRP-like cAMP-binding protein
MKSNNSIALEIFKNISLSKKEIDFIDSKFEKISLTKGDVLLCSDTQVTNQYYVFSGCLRSFFVNSLGKDHTTQFAVKDWWISDYISFFTEEKSVMTIECLQDVEIYRLSRKDMNSLCEDIPKIETFFRNKMEKAFASFQKRILEYLSITAKERYIKFITTYPEIEQCVKNYHIDSYLGITTESLSRIRKIII